MRSETSTGQWLGTPLSPACERAHVLITRHIDGELDRKDVRELRGHLSSCTSCRRTLETQAEQSEMLARSLKQLWSAEDASLKKKWPAAYEAWLKLRHAIPRIATCALLAACVILYMTRNAPPSGASVNEHKSEGLAEARRESSKLPRADVIIATPAAAKVNDSKQPAVQRLESLAPAPDNSTVQNPDFELIDELVAEEFLVVAPRRVEVVPAVVTVAPPVAPAPVNVQPSAPSERTEQTLADLAPPVPLKPLPGVELKYSLITETGAREEGCVTILGDVLRGKAVVRIETSTHQIFDAAQSEVENAFTPERRAVARKLLDECLAPAHRKRIEEAVKKLAE